MKYSVYVFLHMIFLVKCTYLQIFFIAFINSITGLHVFLFYKYLNTVVVAVIKG